MSKVSDAERQKQLQLDWAAVAENPAGQRVLAHILFNMAGVFRPTFSTNALTMAAAEGKRVLGLAIQDELTKNAPQAYVQMVSQQLSSGGTNGN